MPFTFTTVISNNKWNYTKDQSLIEKTENIFRVYDNLNQLPLGIIGVRSVIGSMSWSITA